MARPKKPALKVHDPSDQGGVAMFTRRLDLHGLLAELDAQADAPETETGPQDL